MNSVDEGDRLMTPAEVADVFRVGPKTVTRWAKSGRLASLLTPGRHHRFRESAVRELLGSGNPPEKKIPQQQRRANP